MIANLRGQFLAACRSGSILAEGDRRAAAAQRIPNQAGEEGVESAAIKRHRQGRPARHLLLAGATPAGGGRHVVLAVEPGAEHDRRGFDRAVRQEEERLKDIEA